MKNLLFKQPEPPEPATGPDVVEALGVARSIVRLGWTQRAGTAVIDGQRCYCVVGAITAASPTKQIRDAAIHAAQLALPRHFVGRSLETFNDHHEHDVADVDWLLSAAVSFVHQAVAA